MDIPIYTSAPARRVLLHPWPRHRQPYPSIPRPAAVRPGGSESVTAARSERGRERVLSAFPVSLWRVLWLLRLCLGLSCCPSTSPGVSVPPRPPAAPVASLVASQDGEGEGMTSTPPGLLRWGSEYLVTRGSYQMVSTLPKCNLPTASASQNLSTHPGVSKFWVSGNNTERNQETPSRPPLQGVRGGKLDN